TTTATTAKLAVSLYNASGVSVASGKTVTVKYAVAGGTATGGGVDYSLLGTGTLTFGPSNTPQTQYLSLPVKPDTRLEGDGTILVRLSGPVNALLGTTTATNRTLHTYTIDETAPAITPLAGQTFPDGLRTNKKVITGLVTDRSSGVASLQ